MDHFLGVTEMGGLFVAIGLDQSAVNKRLVLG